MFITMGASDWIIVIVYSVLVFNLGIQYERKRRIKKLK